MQLSSELIKKYLEKDFLFTINGIINSNFVYDRPVFWTQSEHLKENCIYFCLPGELSSLPKKLSGSLLFIAETPNLQLKTDTNTIFIVNNLNTLLKVYNFLNDIFSIFENWSLTLSDLLIQDCRIAELIECSHVIFQNPILIHNRDFEFFAYSKFIDNDPHLNFLIGKESSKDAFQDFLLNPDFQKTFLQKQPCFFPDTYTGIKTLYFNIYSDNVFIARIVIPEITTKLNESDKSLLLHFSKYIQTSITKQHISNLQQKLFTLDQLISMALNDELTDDTSFESAMKIFHWENTHKYFCAIFSIDKPVQNSSYKIIRESLEKLIQSASILEQNNTLIMYVNLTLNGHTSPDVIALCTELARDNFLKIGFSRTYIGFTHSFHLLFKQAEIALSYGTRYVPQRWNHAFNSIVDRYLLEKMTNDLPADMVCMPEVVEMYQYDQKHQTKYFITLKEYLAHNMQPVSTAKALFIHRTTLIYRLEKISDLFQINYSNPNDRLFLQLSMMLMENS